MKLSLVIPCYNEEGNVEKLFDAVNKAFENKVEDYEFVFVNDGSSDGTYKKLKELYCDKNEKKNIQVLSFSRNFGKEAAIYAGISKSEGDLICLIDADLQQRPEVVLEMLDVMNSDEDIDCVTAYQEKRRESKAIASAKSMFYKIINRMSEVEFVNGASDFRLMKRPVADALLQMREYHRFSKGMFSYVGFNTRYIPYEVAKRESGETKWSTKKLFRYALEGIFSFSVMPLKLPVYLGYLFLIIAAAVFVLSYFTAQTMAALIISVILLSAGVILVCIGIIGEYLSKVYIQGKDRPIYILKEHLGNDK